MRLLPQDEKFFDLLVEQVKIVFEASGVLVQGISDSGTSRKVRGLEHNGDVAVRQIYRRLHKTFITPIDPEDIHELATRIDEILDHLEAVAYRMDAYGVGRSTPKLPQIAGLVHGCVEAVRDAIEALRRNGVKKPEELTKFCEEINRRELETENLVREAVRDLFAKERDPITLIKQKEIYELLESTADCCEDVADILEAIAVKNS